MRLLRLSSVQISLRQQIALIETESSNVFPVMQRGVRIPGAFLDILEAGFNFQVGMVHRTSDINSLSAKTIKLSVTPVIL